MIYRVDPATGKASVFFDLNTVINQLDPNALDRREAGGELARRVDGLVNWYDIAFDPEGYFDGKPSMFVSSVDRTDPTKNAIYRIGPDGTFMGAFVTFTDGLAAPKFNVNPTGHPGPRPRGPDLPPRPDRRQRHQRRPAATFAALFFNANAYSPGQVISNGDAAHGRHSDRADPRAASSA